MHAWTATAVALFVGCTASQTAVAQQSKPEIVHDAEYYVLATQHGEQWAAQDQDLNRKLAGLRHRLLWQGAHRRH